MSGHIEQLCGQGNACCHLHPRCLGLVVRPVCSHQPMGLPADSKVVSTRLTVMAASKPKSLVPIAHKFMPPAILQDRRRVSAARRALLDKDFAIYGGVLPVTRELKPMAIASSDKNGLSLEDILDAVTAAVEGGQLTRTTWVKQLFAKRADFEAFLERLDDMFEIERLHDRWWQALGALVGGYEIDASGTVSEALWDAAVASGQCRKRAQAA